MISWSVRRAAALTVLVLLAPLTITIGGSGPAGADAGGGVPGVPRIDAGAIGSGLDSACALLGNGSVRCWGDNFTGQLGQGNTATIGNDPGEVPVPVPLPGPAKAIAVGGNFSCALLDVGQLRCWGQNLFGQLAQGYPQARGDDPGETPVAVDLGPGRTAVAVTAGRNHACAILDNGQVHCWGKNDAGQLGQGDTEDIGDEGSERTVLVALARPAVAITASENSTCAVLDTGELRCWGSNTHGQLMQGNTANVGDDLGESTAHVDTGGRAVLAIDGGGDHFCAIYGDQSVHCWGASNAGQLGLGRTADFGDNETNVGHTNLPPGRTAVAVTAGGTNSCAILDNGQLHCWGANGSGQLGQGNNSYIGDDLNESTVAVDMGGPVRAVSVGIAFVCAVTDSGLRCWGTSGIGQLAQGSIVDYGMNPGEVPRLLPPVNLGGLAVGRDSDGDGVRDAVDACPTVAGTLPNGCTAVAPAPEAVLKGKKVLLSTVLAKKQASAKCPAKATVAVKTKSKKGTIKVTKLLRTKTVATGCLVKGNIKLPAKPKKTAKVKVAVSGKKLVTKRLVAVRP